MRLPLLLLALLLAGCPKNIPEDKVPCAGNTDEQIPVCAAACVCSQCASLYARLDCGWTARGCVVLDGGAVSDAVTDPAACLETKE